MTREDLITRIAKLKAMAESAREIGNLHEAEAFARKVSAMLADHHLTATDIEFAAYVEDEPVESERVHGDQFGQGEKRKRTEWIQALAGTIARAHGCQILVTTGSNRITFVGKKSDREVAVYLFCALVPELDRISKREHRKEKRHNGWLPRSWRQSWLLGAAHGIRTQLRDQRKAAEVGASSTALVRLNTGAEAVAAWMADRKWGKPSALGAGALDGNAYQGGKAHGSSMSIRRGVGDSGPSRSLTP